MWPPFSGLSSAASWRFTAARIPPSQDFRVSAISRSRLAHVIARAWPYPGAASRSAWRNATGINHPAAALGLPEAGLGHGLRNAGVAWAL